MSYQMKKCRWFTALFIFCCILITGCQKNASDENFVIDTRNDQVRVNDQIYTYELQDRSLKITYPNGTIYGQEYFGENYTGGYAAGYSGEIGEDDPDGELLAAEILKRENKVILPWLVLGAIGTIMTLAPKFVWYICYGWIFKKAEPSGAILVYTRIVGVILIGVSIVFILI